MNKFLLVVLAIILISSSAFRTRVKEDDTLSDADAHFAEMCLRCLDEGSLSTRLQDGTNTQDHHKWCHDHHDECDDIFAAVNLATD